MIKRNLLYFLILVFFLMFPYYGKGAPFDELPALKKLNDYTIGERRVLKAAKYESRGKHKKAKKLYSEALKYFLLANEQTPASPAIYFYLAFTSEKLEKIIEAEIYYLLGIEIDPNNIKINNYLGQLFLKTDRLDKAKERLEVLKDCDCEEFKELKDAIKNKNS